MRTSLLLLLLPMALTAGCAATQPVAPPADELETRYGKLERVKALQSIENDQLHLEVTVRNPFAEPVVGVRLLFRLLVSRDPDALEIVRKQKVHDGDLAPGAEVTIDLALPRQAGQRGSFGTFLEAFAVERGGKSLPLPPQWQEDPS